MRACSLNTYQLLGLMIFEECVYIAITVSGRIRKTHISLSTDIQQCLTFPQWSHGWLSHLCCISWHICQHDIASLLLRSNFSWKIVINTLLIGSSLQYFYSFSHSHWFLLFSLFIVTFSFLFVTSYPRFFFPLAEELSHPYWINLCTVWRDEISWGWRKPHLILPFWEGEK